MTEPNARSAMTTLLWGILSAAAVRRAWPYLAIAALVVAAWTYADHRGFQRGAESRQPEITALNRTIADVRLKTAAALASDLANKIRVEAEQSKVQVHDESKLRRDLADARAAVERMRKSATTDPRSGGAAHLPGATDPAGPADGAGGDALIPFADALICAGNSVKARGWQDWWRQVQAIDRGTE